MKKVLSLVLCLAMTLSFAAPVSARMLKSKDDTSSSQSTPEKKKSTAKKDTTEKKEATAEKKATKKETTVTTGAALTPIQYVSRVEAIRLTVMGDFASFNDILYSPTVGEAALTRELNNLLTAQDKAISDISKLKAPKEFAKTSSLFKTAAKKSAAALKAAKTALKSEDLSDLEKMVTAFESMSTAMNSAFAEYDRVCAKLIS